MRVVFRHNEISTLKTWLEKLKEGPIAASFAEAPPVLQAFLASDASSVGIGGFISSPSIPAIPRPSFFAIPLLQGWQELWRRSNKIDAIISNAEGWGVEALIEVLVKAGVKSRTIKLFCDNSTFVDAWAGGWSRSTFSNAVIGRLLELSEKADLTVTLNYIKSADNPADKPSRLMPADDAHPLPLSLMPSPPPGCFGGFHPLAEESPYCLSLPSST